MLDNTAANLSDNDIPVVTLDVKNILLPTDGSATAVEAMNVAMGLAKCFGAEVTAVYVDPSHTMDPMERMHEEEAEGVHHSKAGLDVAARSGEKNGIAVNTIVKEGSVVANILEVAREIDADMIVIGDTGRTGVRRMVLGSIAEALLREAHIPVLVVEHGSTPYCLNARTEMPQSARTA